MHVCAYTYATVWLKVSSSYQVDAAASTATATACRTQCKMPL